MSHDNNSYNTTNTYNNVWNNYTIADKRSQILPWSSLLEPRLSHRAIQERRVKIIEVGRYASSRGSESDKLLLFCYRDQ